MSTTTERKLALGTAQFGLAYGISRGERGALSERDIRSIVEDAATAGVEVIDTAPAYGQAERRLGEALPPGHSFRVFTKTEGTDHPDPRLWKAKVLEGVERSLEALRIDVLDGLLEHRPTCFSEENAPYAAEALGWVREKGLARKVGVSIYRPDQLRLPLDLAVCEVVQAPFNVFDQRIVSQGWGRRLAQAGVEVHGRSIFLQGLLLMKSHELPPEMARVAPHLEAFQEDAQGRGYTPLTAALGFARDQVDIQHLVCGVHDSAQWREIIESCARSVGDFAWARAHAQSGADWIEPSSWSLR